MGNTLLSVLSEDIESRLDLYLTCNGQGFYIGPYEDGMVISPDSAPSELFRFETLDELLEGYMVNGHPTERFRRFYLLQDGLTQAPPTGGRSRWQQRTHSK